MDTLKQNNIEEDVYIIPAAFDKMKESIIPGREEALIYKVIGFCKINYQFCFKVINLFYKVEFHIPYTNIIDGFYVLMSESEYLAVKLVGEIN